MARICVVLSGCGVFDGSEIHEAVCTLLALDQAGATYQCCAPDVAQLHVVDHLAGAPVEGETRNVLIESARIARGQIIPLAEVKADEYDGFIFPGGFGAAKNLCNFAVAGPDCEVQPEVARLISSAHAAGKPIALVCIAPVIAAKVLGVSNVKAKLTIGQDAETANAINAMGAMHLECPTKEAVVDSENKLITSPAYMTAGGISDVFESVKATVAELLKLAG